MGRSTRFVYLHRQLEQLVENAVCLLCLLEARLHCSAQRLDLAREVPLDRLLILARGVVGMSDEQLDDVVHARAERRAPLVDLVEIDEGAVQSEGTRVDELRDRRAEAVWVADVFETIGWPHEFEVGGRRDEGQLSYSTQGIYALNPWLLLCKMQR